ncbi:MAG: DUF3090 family protein [Dehalococcoidia bacterium]
MPTPRHDLGVAVTLKAEALGVPGERRFRLVVEAQQGSATIWMEKEQLSVLALSIKAAIAELRQRLRDPASASPADAAGEPTFDFKAASLALSLDETRGRFGILAATPEDAKANRATLIVWVDRDQAERMADEALEIVAAGRPICPLCHGPIDPDGHLCPLHNGHGPVDEHL